MSNVWQAENTANSANVNEFLEAVQQKLGTGESEQGKKKKQILNTTEGSSHQFLCYKS